MFRRREPVPFAFVAEADRFRSNVTPPPRERPTVTPSSPGRTLVGLTVVAGLVGSLLVRDARAAVRVRRRQTSAVRGVRGPLTRPDPRGGRAGVPAR